MDSLLKDMMKGNPDLAARNPSLTVEDAPKRSKGRPEGKFPVMKTFIGPLYSVVQQLPEFINAAAAQWAEKESK